MKYRTYFSKCLDFTYFTNKRIILLILCCRVPFLNNLSLFFFLDHIMIYGIFQKFFINASTGQQNTFRKLHYKL